MTNSELEEQFVFSAQTSFPDIDMKKRHFSVNWTNDFSETNLIKVGAYVSSTKVKQRFNVDLLMIGLSPELRTLYLQNPEYVTALFSGDMPSGGTDSNKVLALAVYQQQQELTAQG